MHGQPYEQMRREAGNWVKRGRARLVRHLVQSHAPDGPLRILEVGAGFGGNIELLASLGTVDASESHPDGAAALAEIPSVRRLFTDPLPFEIDDHWDLICAIEVLEHLEDDAGAVRWIVDHLVVGGIGVITVPAHPAMYTDHDRVVGHHRRYSKRALLDLVPDDAELLTVGWFVTTALPAQAIVQRAWHWSRKLRGDTRHRKPASPSSGPIDRLLGAALRVELGLLERGVKLPIGSSLYAVIRRS